jgi:hypothetical protein
MTTEPPKTDRERAKDGFIALLVEAHRIETGCTSENLCPECRYAGGPA